MENIQLDISKGRTVRDVQQDFSQRYPFLKLDFYKTDSFASLAMTSQHLPHSTLLKYAGLVEAGLLEIGDEMTVGELEKTFREQFGLYVQVSRNSGGVWLQTTMTDNWTLLKQNNYGREIVQHAKRNIPGY